MITDQEYLNYENEAKEFICNEFNMDKNELNVEIRLTKDWYSERNKIHIKPIEKNEQKEVDNQPNGEYFPIYFQNESNGKTPIILINGSKLNKKKTKGIITSVYIHEIVHYLDDREYDTFCKRYRMKIDINVEKNSINDRLSGYYQLRSEMRAKYYQEKYCCRGIRIDRGYCSYELTEINSANDSYNMAHAMGQIKCWHDVARKNGYDPKIENLEQDLLTRYPECEDFNQMFDIEDFYRFCDNEKNSEK